MRHLELHNLRGRRPRELSYLLVYKPADLICRANPATFSTLNTELWDPASEQVTRVRALLLRGPDS